MPNFILPLIFTKRIGDVFDDTARRDNALPNPGGKPQSVPEGQDKLNVIDLSSEALAKEEAEATETNKDLWAILKKLGA